MAALAADIQFGVDGNDLVLEATSPPPSEMLDLLRNHKAEILAFIRLGHDGAQSRSEAEAANASHQHVTFPYTKTVL
jgi:hypothetical protein